MTNITSNITLLRFPVISFRKIVSPYEDEGAKDYVAVANIKELPVEINEWRKINVRAAKISSNVSKGIRETLENAPESFFFKNRGLTLITDKVRFDNSKNVVELELTDKEYQGLLDGGHTFSVIQKYLQEFEDPSDAFVRIEILEGFTDNDEIVGIVEARNKSTQVQEQSIQELLHRFDPIKKVLASQPYAENIGYKEYELSDDQRKKHIDIKDILSYLLCFYTDEFDRDNHPTRAYTQKTGIVVQYAKDMDDSGKQTFKKFIPLIPKILELRDIINEEFKTIYNKVGRKFALLEGVKEKKKNQKPIVLDFTGKAIYYRLPVAYVYPLLAAFRAAVECKNNRCHWKTDPIELFHELKEGLISRLAEQARFHKNADKLGKDSTAWGRCYDLVLMEMMNKNK